MVSSTLAVCAVLLYPCCMAVSPAKRTKTSRRQQLRKLRLALLDDGWRLVLFLLDLGLLVALAYASIELFVPRCCVDAL